MSHSNYIDRLLPWLWAALACVVLAGCSSPGGQECDVDSDCPDAYKCASTGGVVFGERICLFSGPSNDAGEVGVSDATDATDATEPSSDTGADADSADAQDADSADAPDGCSGCSIGGECFDEGASHPSSTCLYCDSSQPEAWSTRPDGHGCDNGDGLGCTGVCSVGACIDGLREGHCLIDGTCRGDGDANPDVPCEHCDSSTDPQGWSIAEGATCDDGISCTYAGRCDADGQCQTGPPTHDACFIDDTCYDEGQSTPDDACLVCNPLGDPYAWEIDSGAACDDGIVCTDPGTCTDSGACQRGPISTGFCLIGGSCYADGQDNPSNRCQKCDASHDQQSWTDKAAQERCDSPSGQYCICDANAQCMQIFSGPCPD